MTRPTLSVTVAGTEIGTYVKHIHIEAGGRQAYGPPTPSRCTITLDNSSRVFDTWYSGLTIALDGDLIVRVDENPTYFKLFGGMGIFNRWEYQWGDSPVDNEATLTTFGSLAYLARFDGIVAAGASDTAQANVEAAADTPSVTFTVVGRDGGDTSCTTVADIDIGDNVLAYIRSVVQSELGWLHDYDQAEDLVFVSRTQRLAPSCRTFTNNPADATEIDYEKISASTELDLIYGGVRGQRDGGTEQRYPTNPAVYTAPEYDFGGQHLSSDAQVLDAATVIQTHNDASTFRELTFNPDAIDTTDCWDVVKNMGRESDDADHVGIGAKITAEHAFGALPGIGSTAAIEMDCFVEGWAMDIPVTPDGPWLVTLYLSSAYGWDSDETISTLQTADQVVLLEGVSTGSASFTASAGANRMLVAVWVSEDATARWPTSITFDGVALTELAHVEETSETTDLACAVWVLPEASIPSGSKTMEVSLSGSLGGTGKGILSVVVYDNVDQGGAVSIVTGHSAVDWTSLAATLDPARPIDRCVLAVAGGTDQALSATAPAVADLDWTYSTLRSFSAAVAHLDSPTLGASNTITVTSAGTQDRRCHIGFALRPALV